jgi:arylsulfatase A-like enzyme
VDWIIDAENIEEYNISAKNHFGVMEVRDEDTLTAFTVRKTVKFLKSNPPEPFCVTCSILHPHLPFTPNATYAAMFDPQKIAMPDNIDAYYYQPLTIHPGRKPAIPDLLSADANGLGQCLALYYALAKEIDDWFGKLMDALGQSGLKDDTLVIFTSDHGSLMGSHKMISKFQFFEESLRIPLIIRYPGDIPQNLRLKCPATGADIAPTILDYCGIEPLAQFHGNSLRNVIEGNQPKEAWAFSESRGHTCFRSSEWKIVFNPKIEAVMLFNLREDPGEFRNLLDEGSLPEYAQRLIRDTKAKLLKEYKSL